MLQDQPPHTPASAAQAAVAPPTFILFTNRQVKLHFAFQRFLENQIRAAFDFRGSPIWFKVRAREK